MAASLRILAGLAFLAVTSAALLSPFAVVGQLTTDYYAGICPNLETIVRSSVRQSMAASPIAAPATLRLFFHDCAVRGCDASVMIVNSNGDDEWRSSDNQSLKPEGFTTVLNAKAAVDSDPRCRYKVSCADILALAARESVYQSGGPYYQVELGRHDGRVSTRDNVVLPHASFNLHQLNAFFTGLGLSQTDMIALSGGHTFGAADCRFFQYRVGADPSMDAAFASELRNTCGAGAGANPSGGGFAFLDGATPATFDNAYYQNLQRGRGLLGSDQALHADQRSRGTVDYYAGSQSAFFSDFAAAMTRLGRVGVKSAATGEIRRDCRFPN
ncbi:peroxidase 45-like [Oryza brachyantha]|uniref:peroxidase 45-like n=1 Tax=Oryza brachyantha TaxID=4533 RepID=UPI001ADAF1B4|nr:peroxidase 45-like [Oryza brachyantha]